MDGANVGIVVPLLELVGSVGTEGVVSFVAAVGARVGVSVSFTEEYILSW